MLKVEKREGTKNWQIVGTCPYSGAAYRESARTPDRRQAEDKVAAILARNREEHISGGASGTALFAEAVIEYTAKSGNARFVEPLLERFGRTPMRDIKDTDITKFCDEVYPHCIASTLVRQVYGPMQAIWNQAVESKLAQPRTFAKPKIEAKPVDIPTEDDLLVILRSMKSTGHERSLHQRAATLFMSYSGARASEVINVLVKHYDPGPADDMSKGRVLLADTKTGVPRWTALPTFVNRVLYELPRERADAPMLGYASRWSLSRIIKRAIRRANRERAEAGQPPIVKNYSPHKLGRHLFAKRFLEDGNSLKALMDAGGWTTLKAVSVYAHIERKMIDNAVAGVTTKISAASDVLDTSRTVPTQSLIGSDAKGS